MPTSLPARPLPPPSTTGMPEMRCAFIRSSASASVAPGCMVTGFTTMPLSNFLTWRTWAAWSSGSRLRWMTPMPPACAMAIAISVSVTVSMAEATMGMLSGMVRVMRVRMSASDGNSSDSPGLIRTSSKVSASRGGVRGFKTMANSSLAPHPSVGALPSTAGVNWRPAAGPGFPRPNRRPFLGWRWPIARLPDKS
jgi:hypothetical protein